MIQQLLLTRSGYFEVLDVADDTHQCGGRGERKIRYHVSIIGDPSKLTPEGFVLDNNQIQQYFDFTWKQVNVLPSCERIAMQSCEDIARLVGCPVRVEVTVGGTPQAGLTAFWTPEDGAGLGCLFPRVDEVQRLASEEVISAMGEGKSALVGFTRVFEKAKSVA